MIETTQFQVFPQEYSPLFTYWLQWNYCTETFTGMPLYSTAYIYSGSGIYRPI